MKMYNKSVYALLWRMLAHRYGKGVVEELYQETPSAGRLLEPSRVSKDPLTAGDLRRATHASLRLVEALVSFLLLRFHWLVWAC